MHPNERRGFSYDGLSEDAQAEMLTDDAQQQLLSELIP